MEYKILIANEKVLYKDLEKIPKKEVEKFWKAIADLKNNPWPENLQVKKLQNYKIADFRLRVGEYRILFDRDMEKNELVIFRILHRSKLY